MSTHVGRKSGARAAQLNPHNIRARDWSKRNISGTCSYMQILMQKVFMPPFARRLASVLVPVLPLLMSFPSPAEPDISKPLPQGLAANAAPAETPEFPLPATASPEASAKFGENIQRTMTLLATSTRTHRKRVKILFYGQSITEQTWSKTVADDLRRRFPNADLEIQNRAIGGFSTQILHKTAEHDLYPFYPDLTILYVYGSHLDYLTLVDNIRRRTTSEILLQNEHVTTEGDLTEETNFDKVPQSSWGAWMSYHFLSETADKYGAELVDQRTPWKAYLRDNKLEPRDLLIDGVHLNKRGNFLMAELVKPHLIYNPKLSIEPWKKLVHEYSYQGGLKTDKAISVKNNRLSLKFDGNRIDLVAGTPRVRGKLARTLRVLIDGKKPSEHPELYAFTRPSSTPNVGWPAIIRVDHEKPLIVEEWTARITRINEDASKFKFDVTGSKTGPDGSGTSEARFVSNSGRVVIEPENWWPHHDWELTKKPTPVGFETKWRVVPSFTDTYTAPRIEDRTREYATTLAQGLSNNSHTLELIADGGVMPIESIRVYQPPLS